MASPCVVYIILGDKFLIFYTKNKISEYFSLNTMIGFGVGRGQAPLSAMKQVCVCSLYILRFVLCLHSCCSRGEGRGGDTLILGEGARTLWHSLDHFCHLQFCCAIHTFITDPFPTKITPCSQPSPSDFYHQMLN